MKLNVKYMIAAFALLGLVGCDKNFVSYEVRLGMLKERGYTFTDDQTRAAAAVVNT